MKKSFKFGKFVTLRNPFRIPKKGYYFIVDSLIAVMILVIGFMLVSSFYISKPAKLEIKYSADNIVNLLSGTKFYDLCSEEEEVCSDPVLQKLYKNKVIKNKENSLLEVIGEAIRIHEEKEAIDIISDIINSIIVKNKMVPLGYNLTFYIKTPDAEVMVYPKERIPSTIIQRSKALVTSKKVIFGYFEGSTIYWGPYTAEVNILRLEHYIKCETNKDCRGMICDPTHKICVNEICIGGEHCESSAHCCGGYDFYCSDEGECTPISTDIGQFCTSESACGPGYYCNKMRCWYTPGDIGDPCGYNDDCGQGLICDQGTCSKVLSEEGDSCNEIIKCGVGLYCSIIDGICKKSRGSGGGGGKGETGCGIIGDFCDSNTDCCSGRCVEVNGEEKCVESSYNENEECSEYGDCGPGLVCSGSSCQPTTGEQGTSCGNHDDCGVGLICDEDHTCQPGDANPGEPCEKEEDCTDGLTCDLTLEPPECVGDECLEQEDCGDGLICDMGLETPICVVTEDGAGEVCETDSDCNSGFYCDNAKCVNGKSEAGDPCNIPEDCGAHLVCQGGVCVAVTGIPCDPCYSLSDCNIEFEGNMTICDDDKRCHKIDNANHPCGAAADHTYDGACDCGQGLYCSFLSSNCEETLGGDGDPCNTDSDCKASGLKCSPEGFCTPGGDPIDLTAVCGDGIVTFPAEQCDPNSPNNWEKEIRCDSPTLNCEGDAISTCYDENSIKPCTWDRSVCDCPLCVFDPFPPDCRQNCAIALSEGDALYFFWRSNIDYVCGGRLVIPNILMTQCALTLYANLDHKYDENWRSESLKCGAIP